MASQTSPLDLGVLSKHAVPTSKRSPGRVSLIVALGLCACSPSTFPSPPTSPNEIKKGDAKYPIENPHPTRLVRFHFAIPSSLSFRFEVTYQASSLACRARVGLGGDFPYFVSIPLQIAPTGGDYEATVAIDRFQPGGCGWGFLGVSYWAGNSDQGFNSLAQLQRRDDESVQIDVWCMAEPKLSPQHPEVCGSLGDFSTYVDAPPKGVLESLRSGGPDNDAPASVGPHTISIEVRFHDIDALRRAKSPALQGRHE